MSKADRKGNRKLREQNKCSRKPELGYYLIITDTEATERCYFTGLYQMLPDEVRNKLVIKVVETKTSSMIDKCMEALAYEAQYRLPWIVFDRDKVTNFDKIIEEAKYKNINVGWSNPCFEIWLYSYFGTMPSIQESWNCCSEFKREYERKTGHKYSKTDKHLYRKIYEIGDENQAIKLAKNRHNQYKKELKNKPSKMCPCTTVYALVEEIREKVI